MLPKKTNLVAAQQLRLTRYVVRKHVVELRHLWNDW